jgi:hypothetical protein
MKKYKLLFNEKEVVLLEYMLKHCMDKMRLFQQNRFTSEQFNVLGDIFLKLRNKIEV